MPSFRAWRSCLPPLACLAAAATPGAALAQAFRLQPSPFTSSQVNFGHAAAVVPDVDGDGVLDFAVGAPWEWLSAGGISNYGKVRIFCGATGQQLQLLLPPLGPTSATMYFGRGVAGLAGLTADGLGAVAVGCGSHATAFVHRGGDGSLLRTVSIATPSGFFGHQLSPVPDLDGDGVNDLIVSSASSHTPSAQVFSGATGALVHVLSVPYDGLHRNLFPNAVVGLGDLDGDGLGEVAAANYAEVPVGGSPFSGRVYLFSGGSGELLRAIGPPDEHTAAFGQALARAGDVDLDGVEDLLVGAPVARLPGQDTPVGAAYLISGATGEVLLTVRTPNHNPNPHFGYAVAGGADVDGDGRPDLFIGAQRAHLRGAVYVYSGATGELLRTVRSVDFDTAVWFGASVAVAPSRSGPRRAAMVVGDPRGGSATATIGPGVAELVLFCRADADADGHINSRDIVRFLGGWLATVTLPPGTPGPPGVHHGDYDGDGLVTSADISAFLAAWLEAVVQGGCL